MSENEYPLSSITIYRAVGRSENPKGGNGREGVSTSNVFGIKVRFSKAKKYDLIFHFDLTCPRQFII